MNKQIRTIGMLVLVLAGLVAFPVGVHAEAPVGGEPTMIQLTVDCSLTPDTPEVIEELTKRNLCGYGDGSDDSVQNDTVVGNCGSLTLNLFNDGGGWLHWQAIITSSLGPMFSAEYRGYAHNLDTGGGHIVTKSKSWIFSSYWQSDVPKYTGPGTIFGEIVYARSTLVWGGVCTNAGVPTDVVQVT